MQLHLFQEYKSDKRKRKKKIVSIWHTYCFKQVRIVGNIACIAEVRWMKKMNNILQVESDIDYTAEEELEEPSSSKKKKKKRKKRKKKSGKSFSDNPWQSTSGSSR